MIDLNEMTVFARVVARGSFTAAARELKVPPSTLSRKVAALEKRLGARLLERTTRRLSLTDLGTLYYERCARISAEAEEADASVQALSREPRGTLRISAPPVWGELFLTPVVADYIEQHRGVQVELSLSDRTVDLIAEGFDLALRVTQGLDDSTLVMRRLATSLPLLCASPGYLKAHGAPRSLAELGEHTTLGLGARASESTWRFMDARGELLQVPVAPRVRVNSSRMLRDLCLEGLGIAMLPSFIALEDVKAGRLVQVLPEVRTRPREVCLLLPSARQLSAKVRAFLQVMDRHLAQKRPWG